MTAYGMDDDSKKIDRPFGLGRTMADIIADGLRMDIIQKRIPEGSIITVKEVADRYGVSPMPVRDAFNTLKGENLLEVSPYKHVKVMAIDRDFVSDVYDFTSALERLMIEDVCKYCTDELIDRAEHINEKIKRMVENDDPDKAEEYAHQNGRFHHTLYAAAQNKIAIKQYSYYNDTILNSFRIEYPTSEKRLLSAYEEHRQILEGLKNRDPEAAAKAMRIHNDNAKKDFLEISTD